MKTLLAIPFAVLMAGCSSFSTTQSDTSYEKGLPLRTVNTKVKARQFFGANSTLTSFKASQTDKTQGAVVGSLSQEASGTNVIGLVEAISAGATKGALQFIAPVPVPK